MSRDSIFFNLFVTVFLLILFWSVLNTSVEFRENTHNLMKILFNISIMVIQAGIGALFGMIIYNMWKKERKY